VADVIDMRDTKCVSAVKTSKKTTNNSPTSTIDNTNCPPTLYGPTVSTVGRVLGWTIFFGFGNLRQEDILNRCRHFVNQ
jgi:hypothetical protein